MKPIQPDRLRLGPFRLLDREWALLVAGRDRPNLMTVSWGGFGTLWNKPAVTIYVRPTRHTFGLLNEHPEFTLNVLPDTFREAMNLCGTKSGRDLDKWKASGLHPQESRNIAVPRVAEAVLSFECRVMAHQDFDPQRFVLDEIPSNYPKKDYHRIFWGEPLVILADDAALPNL